MQQIICSFDNKRVNERVQKEKFVYCVNFHRNLLRLLGALQDLYNPIIFVQFFMSCLQICAITLELLLVREWSEHSFSLILVCNLIFFFI